MVVYPVILTIVGVAILTVAWLPSFIKDYPLSYPIIFVLLGMLLYALPLNFPTPNPLAYPTLTTHLTELCVIVSLTGTGLKIDRRFSLKNWKIPIRLASVAMVFTIICFALAGWWLAALPFTSALLLGAALAPTDPVLAGDVQVGDPGEGQEDIVRFSLTGEAGLNDGFAFPFVYLAIVIATLSEPWHGPILFWFLKDVLYRIVVGLLAGWLSGKLLAYLIFGLPKKVSIKSSAYSFVILSVTLITYGLTELIHGYGFFAVFIAALAIRGYERKHEYHQQMHAFSDQIERLFVVVILILFGGAIGNGLLAPLTWKGAILGLFLLLVIRPAIGMLTLRNTKAKRAQRLVIASFGIRGIGSLFYIAFALEKAKFAQPEMLWAITGFIVLVSVIVHGILATPVMKWVDRRTGIRG